MQGPCAISSSNSSAPGLQLPSALQLHILSLLPHNQRVLRGRLVCRDAADAALEATDRTATLSQPLPPDDAPWAQEAGQPHVRQLPFRHKLQLLCTAAASGSEVNLEVAMALLQPSIFPEMLHRFAHYPDPGVAAVKAGQVQVLGWLLHHCPGLLWPHRVLEAAAGHCDLAGLQAVWEVLRSSNRQPDVNQAVLDWAAGSATPDAAAKVEWVLQQGEGECRLQESTALCAADAGQLNVLRWLRDHGCPMGGERVLVRALQHADLAVAQWLVDEAGCTLPAADADDEEGRWEALFKASAKSTDGVAKMQWLEERGFRVQDQPLVYDMANAAAGAGQADMVHHLLRTFGAAAVLLDPDAYDSQRTDPKGEEEAEGEGEGGEGAAGGKGSGNGGVLEILYSAAASGSVPMAAFLRNVRLRFHDGVFTETAKGGHVGMVRWLVREAGVSAADVPLCELEHMIAKWPQVTAADSRGLLEAVQLLLDAGYCSWRIGEAEADGEDSFWKGYKGDVVVAAAQRGDAALVELLLQHRQQLDPQPNWWAALVGAARAGCEALVELLAQQPGCLASGGGGPSPYVAAAGHSDRAVLEVLWRLGVPWGAEDVLVRAVKTWLCKVPALRWLVEHEAPVGPLRSMNKTVKQRVRLGDLSDDEAWWLQSVALMADIAAVVAAREEDE